MTIPKSALIVDDESHIRLFIKLILTEMGIQNIREAKNGQEAFDLYKAERPGAVFMDVNMPVLSGLEALEKIVGHDPSAFVVMLTSAATREVVEACVTKGAMQYIRKDTPKDEIVKILNTTFEEYTEA